MEFSQDFLPQPLISERLSIGKEPIKGTDLPRQLQDISHLSFCLIFKTTKFLRTMLMKKRMMISYVRLSYIDADFHAQSTLLLPCWYLGT